MKRRSQNKSPKKAPTKPLTLTKALKAVQKVERPTEAKRMARQAKLTAHQEALTRAQKLGILDRWTAGIVASLYTRSDSRSKAVLSKYFGERSQS